MVDTARSQDSFLNASTGLFKDNVAGDISAQDLRDFTLTAFGASFPKAVSGTATLEAGDLAIVTSAGSDFTVSLPASPVAGNVCGLFYKTQTAGDLITLGRNGKQINGAASDLAIFTLPNEFAVVAYDGTEWWVVGKRLIPHTCRLRSTAQQTNFTQATFVQLTFDTKDWDNAGIGSTANDDITIRRAGRYCLGLSYSLANATSGHNYLHEIQINNGATRVSGHQDEAFTSTVNGSVVVTRTMAANDTVEGWEYSQENGTTDTNVGNEAVQAKLWVVELLDGLT